MLKKFTRRPMLREWRWQVGSSSAVQDLIWFLFLLLAPSFHSCLVLADDPNPERRLLSYGSPIDSSGAEDAVLESLYRWGLVQLAVDRCEAELRRSGLSRFDQMQWASRLITSLAVRDSSAKSIGDALKNASGVAKPYIDSAEPDANVLWIRFALANARYIVTERNVAVYLAAPMNQERREDCLASLRLIVDAQSSFQDQVQEAIGKLPRANGRETNKGILDLASLRNQSLLLHINATLLRGRLYEPKSVDAIAAASETMTAVERALNATEEKWAGRASLELAHWDAMRMVGRNQEALTGLEKWILKYPANTLLSRAIAIGVETSIGNSVGLDVDSWLQRAKGLPQDAKSPELDIAKLKWMIVQWQAMKDQNKDAKEEQLRSILKKRDQIAEDFGKYWGLRGEAAILASPSLPANRTKMPDDSNGDAESMSLIKLQVKQLLAADRIADAVDRLRQAESIASKNGNDSQAFELAKLQIGLLMKSIHSSKESSSASRISKLSDLAQQIESTTLSYSALTGADELNRFAESILLEVWKLESESSDKSRRWKIYEQHLLDHIENWPKSSTSLVVREQLVASYLLEGRVSDLVTIWQKATLETSSREERLVDALLLSVFLQVPNTLPVELLDSAATLSDPFKRSFRALSGDWTWWKSDDGIDRMIATETVAALPLITTTKNEVRATDSEKTVLPTDSVAIIISELTKKTSSSDIDQAFLMNAEVQLEKLTDWIDVAPVSRIGWAIAMSRSAISILDERVQVEPNWIAEGTSRHIISTLFSQLQMSLKLALKSGEKTLNPKIIRLIQEEIFSLDARILALAGKLNESDAVLLRLKSESPRDPKWSQELASLQFWRQPGNVDDRSIAIGKSILIYKELAAGSPVGSDRWFDARIRVARCFLIQGNQERANEAISLTKALVGELSPKWRTRVAQYGG